MKYFKHVLAAILTAVIITGTIAPVQTRAATKVTSVKVYSVESNYAFLIVGTRGTGKTTKYQYKVYKNGRIVKSGYSNPQTIKTYEGNKVACKVSVPTNTACAVRVRAKRGGAWSAWSGYAGIVPPLRFTMFNATKKTITYNWRRMAGATDYSAYYRPSGSSTWRWIKTVKPSTTKMTVNFSKWPKENCYCFKIIARKKINGKYVYGTMNRELYINLFDGEVQFFD